MAVTPACSFLIFSFSDTRSESCVGGEPSRSFLLYQSYSFQSDRIPPNPPIVEHSLPGFREKSVSKFFGNLDRPDQSGVCPFADLIVRPDDNVGALRHLRSNWETVCNLLGGLDRDFESKIVFEFLCRDRLESLASVGVHPD